MNLDTDHQQPLISQKERQSDVSLMVVPFMKYSCQLNQNLIKHLDPTANLEIKKTKKKKNMSHYTTEMQSATTRLMETLLDK